VGGKALPRVPGHSSFTSMAGAALLRRGGRGRVAVSVGDRRDRVEE